MGELSEGEGLHPKGDDVVHGGDHERSANAFALGREDLEPEWKE